MNDIVNDFVIVGLGNPGRQYEKTRHNLGFLFVEALAKELGIVFSWEDKCTSWLAKYKGGKGTFFILKPGTYMNRSGRALGKFLEYFRPNQPEVIVVVDDLDLPLGKMRLRLNGSSGGHNGLKSIQGALHTTEYKRLKIGIGRPKDSDSDLYATTTDFVLGDIQKEEDEVLQKLIEKAVKVFVDIDKKPIEEIIEHINSNTV